MKNKQTNGAISRRLIIITLAAVIGFSMAGCGDLDPGSNPQKATYVSTDDNGNKYTLEIDETGGRSAQQGDTFKLTVEYSTAFGGGGFKMTFEYSGTVSAAQTSGARVSLRLDINGERITITIVGTEMTVITGKIVNDYGEEVVNNPGPVTPVNPAHTHNYSATWTYNETQHWHECSCGDKTAVGYHSGNPCNVCGYSSDDGQGDLLNGAWDRGDIVVTFSGSAGVFTEIKSNAYGGGWLTIMNNGEISIGDRKFRNITYKNNLTWTGQEYIQNLSWANTTLTISGQTLRVETPNASPSVTTYTKVSEGDLLNGAWDRGDIVVTFSGNAGVFTEIKSNAHGGGWLTIMNNGEISIGDRKFRNITYKNNLTWTGQELIQSLSWANTTLTMSGQTLRVETPNASPSVTNYTKVY